MARWFASVRGIEWGASRNFEHMYKYFLAFRYLRRRLVSILAVLGIAVGVMVLLVVTSVMGGFARDLKAKLRGVSAHLSVKAPQGRFIYDYERLCEQLEKIPNVVAVAPRVEWPVLFGEQYLGWIIGIDPLREGKTTDFNRFLLGRDPGFKPDPFDLGRPPIIIGHTISPLVNRATYVCSWEGMEWQIFTARPVYEKGTITVTGLRARPSRGPLPFCLVPSSFRYLRSDHWTRRLEQRDMKFVISGAYSSGMSEFDNANSFVPLWAAQELVAGPDAVTRICIAVTDYEDPKVMDSVKKAAADLTRQFPGILVETWEEEKQTLLNAVQMERSLNAIILFFIVLVAGFLILAILLMMVAEKRRDIGILRAVGAPAKGILALFLFKATIMAFLGCCLGLASGFAVTTYINNIADAVHKLVGWHPFPPEIYLLDKIPAEIEPGSILVIALATIASSLVISAYAAVRAALLNPANALRYE